MRIEQTVRTIDFGNFIGLHETLREMAKDNWMVVSFTPWGNTVIILFQRTVQ